MFLIFLIRGKHILEVLHYLKHKAHLSKSFSFMQWKTCETGSKIKGNYRLGPREPVRVRGCIHQGNTFLGAPFPS